MPSTRDIRRRIKSIKNTSKITHAMEMVSSAKMRKAVQSVLQIRPYAQSAWKVLTNLSRVASKKHTGLLEIREVKNILVVLVASNRGLCGAFNSQIYKTIREEVSNPERLKVQRDARPHRYAKRFGRGGKKLESLIPNNELKIDFITIGKKAEGMARKMEKEIIATFSDVGHLLAIETIRPLVKIILEDYKNKKYDKVAVVYTDYISTLSQKTKIRQLLPISRIDIEKQTQEMDELAKVYGIKEEAEEYKIEPSPKEVLEYIVPRLLEMQVYHAILESNASEESARMMAMKNATEAALDMVDDFTFVYNQIRQMKITQEIAEISAGRAALEG